MKPEAAKSNLSAHAARALMLVLGFLAIYASLNHLVTTASGYGGSHTARPDDCKADGEGTWSIGMYFGASPFALLPLEKRLPRVDTATAWPIANPVVTCATLKGAAAGSFAADPFLWPVGDKLYLFYESKTASDKQGDIAVAVSTDGGATFTTGGLVLDEPWHLSYPFVFEHDKKMYMMPEGAKSGQLSLYLATDFPRGWVRETVLVDRPLVDASLVQWEGGWWMFASDASRSSSHNCREMEVWAAASPLGPWALHPASPVREGQQGSRGGGRPFVHDGKLYRLAQDCGKTYGHQLRAFHVVTLTASEYADVEVPLPFLKHVTAKAHRHWSGVRASHPSRGRHHHMDAHQLADNSWVAALDGDRDVSNYLWAHRWMRFAYLGPITLVLLLLIDFMYRRHASQLLRMLQPLLTRFGISASSPPGGLSSGLGPFGTPRPSRSSPSPGSALLLHVELSDAVATTCTSKSDATAHIQPRRSVTNSFSNAFELLGKGGGGGGAVDDPGSQQAAAADCEGLHHPEKLKGGEGSSGGAGGAGGGSAPSWWPRMYGKRWWAVVLASLAASAYGVFCFVWTFCKWQILLSVIWYMNAMGGPPNAIPVDGQYSQFTMMVMSYDVRAMYVDAFVKHYSRCPSVSDIVVVWNKGTPPDVSAMDSAVPVRVRVEAANSLNNRFRPDPLITNRAVMELDDDIMMPCADIERGFAAWRKHPDRITGFYIRYLEGESAQYMCTNCERHTVNSGLYNIVLTGAAFVDRDTMFDLYWSAHNAAGRGLVDEFMNCEDLLMNYLVAESLGKGVQYAQYIRPSKRLDVGKLTSKRLSAAGGNFGTSRHTCNERFNEWFKRPLEPEGFPIDWAGYGPPNCDTPLGCIY